MTQPPDPDSAPLPDTPKRSDAPLSDAHLPDVHPTIVAAVPMWVVAAVVAGSWSAVPRPDQPLMLATILTVATVAAGVTAWTLKMRRVRADGD